MEEKEQKGNPPSPSSSSRGSAGRGAVERMKLLAADFPKTHSPIRRFNTGSLKAGAKCVACIRASLSLFVLSARLRSPIPGYIIGSPPDKQEGRRKRE